MGVFVCLFWTTTIISAIYTRAGTFHLLLFAVKKGDNPDGFLLNGGIVLGLRELREYRLMPMQKVVPGVSLRTRTLSLVTACILDWKNLEKSNYKVL